MTKKSGGKFSSSSNVAESVVWCNLFVMGLFFFNADLQTIQQH